MNRSDVVVELHAERGEQLFGWLLVFLLHSFSLCTVRVLLSFGSDVGISVKRRFRGAFSVWCVFPSFILFFVFSVSFLGELNYHVNENML